MEQFKFSQENLLDMERAYCKRSLSNFIKRAWHVLEVDPYIHGWHIGGMCEHLEAVSRGEITRLLINIPPGCMKSMLVAVFWPSWEWGPMGNPHIRIISASHSSDLSTRDNLKTRRLITSEWYQSLWPIKLTSDQNKKMSFENDKTGWRQSCAIASMTGLRGDRVYWDDPHSIEDSHSRVKLATTERIFEETLPTRLNNPEKSAICIIMQRSNEGDVSHLAINAGYEHLMLPMEFEPHRRCVTSIGFEDPRKEEGELLFPDRFTPDVVDKLKATMSKHAVAGQLQQRPNPLGGGVIKSENFKYYSILPKLSHRVIRADTAQKTKEHNDYSVFQCWGVSEGRLYLVDQIRGKWLAPELERRAVQFWQKHLTEDKTMLGSLRKMEVEDVASGTGLIQTLKIKYRIPIFGIIRTKDKFSRIMDVLNYIESGLIYLPECAPWISDFISECEEFRADDTHAHDDQIDPMIDAITSELAKGVPWYMKLK